jgi:hypothetical protein
MAFADSFAPSTQHCGALVTTDTRKSDLKARLDNLLLKLPGVRTKTINGFDAYFVSDRMFACISGNGVGLRLPVAVARELHFSRGDVAPFQPGGVTSTQEWIQIERADVGDYDRELPLFRASIEFVAGRTR